MNKYKVTIAATSYHEVKVSSQNEDQAEHDAIKKCHQDSPNAIGAVEYEIIDMEELAD